jgi:hypothetical protein
MMATKLRFAAGGSCGGRRQRDRARDAHTIAGWAERYLSWRNGKH